MVIPGLCNFSVFLSGAKASDTLLGLNYTPYILLWNDLPDFCYHSRIRRNRATGQS